VFDLFAQYQAGAILPYFARFADPRQGPVCGALF
jgi:hypothetical protein